MILFLAKPA